MITLNLLCVAVTANSQALTFNQAELLKIANTPNQISASGFDNQYAGIAGSPYFDDNWLPANAIMTTGKIYTGLRAKINLFTNQYFVNINDTIYDVSGVPTLQKLILFPSVDTFTRAIFPLLVPELGKHIAVQSLTEGKISLYKLQSRNLEEMQTGVNTAKEKVFTKNTSYFVVKDHNYFEVKLQKKSLQKAFSEEEWNQLTRFTVSQKLSLTNERDLTKAISQLNIL